MSIRPAILKIQNAGRFVFVVILLWAILPTQHVLAVPDAPKLQNRSLSLSNMNVGATATYTFRWTYPSVNNLGSIRLKFCNNPFFDDAPCNTPAGTDASAAILSGQTGNTNFSILSQTTNEIIISRPIAPAGVVASSYIFDNVTNPNLPVSTLYVQVQTYVTTDATGPATEISSVVTSILDVNITAEVPPILDYCVGLAIAGPGFCDNIDSTNFIDFDTLEDTQTDYGSAQFQVRTNAPGGYVVTTTGLTMTSGTKTIAALATPTVPIVGTPQFGLNLRDNSLPDVGANISGMGIGAVAGDYNTPDMYKYVDSDVVAFAVAPTYDNKYTASFIVNVPTDQPGGIYNTTISFYCTGAF